MKVKFTKLAALLLAGAALLAAGCTDYEVDIQNVDKKVDQLSANTDKSVADLNTLINAQKTALDEYKTTVKTELDALKKADKDNYDALKKLNDDLSDALDQAKKDFTAAIGETNGNVQALSDAFNAYKAATDKAIGDLQTGLGALETKHDADLKKLNEETLPALKKEIEDEIDALETRLTKLISDETDAREKAISDLKTYVDQKDGEITTALGNLRTEMEAWIAIYQKKILDNEAAIKVLNEVTIPGLETRIKALETFKTDAEAQILALQQNKLDKAEFESWLEDEYQPMMNIFINELFYLDEEGNVGSYIDYLFAWLDAVDAEVFNEDGESNIDILFDEVAKKLNIEDFNTFVQAYTTRFEDYETFKDKTKTDIAALFSLVNTKLDKEVFDAFKTEYLARFADYESFKSKVETFLDKTYPKDLLDLKNEDIRLNSEIEKLQARAKTLETVLGMTEEGKSSVLDGLRADLNKEIADRKALAETLKNEITRVEGLIEAAETRLQDQLDKITNAEGTGRLDLLEINVDVLAQLTDMSFDFVNTSIDQLNTKVNNAIDEYRGEITRIDGEIAVIKSRITKNEEEIKKLLSRIQSIVYVPDYDDQKMTMNLVYYTDYDGHFLVLGKDTEVEYKVNPADAFADLGTLKRLVADNALVFDVKSVKVRSSEENEAKPGFQIKDVTKYDPSTGKFTLLVRPENIVSPAFADYQVDPTAMYFALLQYSQEGSKIDLLQKEDGTYFLATVPFGPDYADNPTDVEGYTWGSEDIQTGWETVIDVPEGMVNDPQYFREKYNLAWYVVVPNNPYLRYLLFVIPGLNNGIDFQEIMNDAATYPLRYQAEVSHEEPVFVNYSWFMYSAEALEQYRQAIQAVQDAIDQYNADVEAGILSENERIEKYNDLVEKYNAAVEAYNEALAKYFDGLQRRGGSKNFAAALNIYIDDQATNISSTYTTLYPSKYEESEHIQILKQPYIMGEDGKVVKYGDRNQDIAFNSKDVKEILDGAIPAVKVTNAQGRKGRILSYPQAQAEGYLVIEPTWSNAEISYKPKKEAKYFVVENEFEDKVPPYATVEMNYEDPNHPEGGFNNATLKGRVGDVVTGKYTLTDNMFGNEWTWKGTVTVVPPTAGIDLSLENPITWTYANDAVIDHNRFYKVADASTEYFRNDQVVKINTDLSQIEKEFGITPANLQGILPTDKDREVVMYSVVAKDAKGKEVAYNVHYEDGVYVAYTVDADGVETLAEDIDPLKIGHVDLDSKTAKLDMNITNFEWDMTYTVKANYYYSEPNSEKVSVIVAVNFVFNTVDRSRAKVVLPLNEYTFNINQFDETTGFGFVEKDPFADSYYAWKGAPQHAAIKAGFEAAGVTKASDFKDQAAFNAAELTGKIEMAKPSGSAAGYIDIDKAGIFGQTMSSFKGSILQKFAQKDEKGNFVQDPENPYKFLGAVQTRNITTYIGQEVEIPFKFNWIVPAYDYKPLENQTMQDEAGVWYSFAAPKYENNRDVLTHYDVSFMNVPALAFNIVDKSGNYFNWKDKENAAPYFYDANLVSSFFYTDPEFGDVDLDENSQTETLKKYADLWSSDEKVNFEHSVFYYRSTLDAIPMFGKLEVKSGDARFEIPTSFGNPYNGVKLAETPYSNYELRAWKPFVVDSYKQTLNLDLNNPGMYEIDLLKGIQFFDARQVKESTPLSSTIRVANGVKCWVRPMMKTNGGWVVGNGQAANGYANGVTSAQAYEIKVADFDWDSTSAVPAQYRGLINIVEDPENYTYKMQFDYTSEIAFQKTAEVKFTFELQTRWQVLEPFEVTVVIRGLDAQ